MGKYKHNQSIERGLGILTALNRNPDATITAISRETGIHRTTVYRMLETLEQLGYVRRSASDDRYCLTLKVRSLSDGFDEHDWVAGIASPVMGKLFRDVLWPTSLAIFHRDAMVLRETTHRFSPFSVHRSMVGRRLPVFTTAHGRAYLAFSGQKERAALLDALASSGGPESGLARDRRYVAQLIQTAQQHGYGTSREEAESGISSFALPIRWNGLVVATLNLVFFTSSMTIDVATERYLEALRRGVQEIEDGLSRREGEFLGELMPARPSSG